MPDTITIIANAASGAGGDADPEQTLRRSLDANGLKAEIALARSGEEIVAIARRALDTGCRMLVAAGGDGTVNALAGLVANTGVTLGVLPLGTLNHFAKDLAIPLDLDAAVGVLASGTPVLLDAGEVNGNIFINNSSLGLYPHMVGHRREQQRLGRNKWLALVWSAMTMLGRYPRLRVGVAAGGQRKVITTPLVFIGNNEYALHGFEIGKRNRLDRGVLSLYVPHHVGRAGFVWMAVRALLGLLRDDGTFDSECVNEITIETGASRIRVALDGEVRMLGTPLRYRILPGVLRVMAPRPADAEYANETKTTAAVTS